MNTEAIQTHTLSKRYGAFWALKDCALTIPEGSITALVGSNGAGKSTLLNLLTGLTKPTKGTSSVLGIEPTQNVTFLTNVGYLAQDIPLYPQLSAEDYIHMGAHMNGTWDETIMRKRLTALSIPLDRPVGKLSGGQRAQVGLAMAIAKKPKILLLDEPVAALDPLARREFLQSLSEAVVDHTLTVVMSSHLLADLELICDHIIIMANGSVQLFGEIDTIVKSHMLLTSSRDQTLPENIPYTVINETHTARQSTVLIRIDSGQMPHDKAWQVHDISIEDIVLAYMSKGLATRDEQKKGVTV